MSPINPVNNERIFIIDDEPANIRLLEKILNGQGYNKLTKIADPREVLKRYLKQSPSLILLDINMPHLNGYQVMAQLKALEDPLLPPIIILTAQHSSDYLLRALAGGARDFISKPFDRNELLMRVRNLLDVHLAHRLLHDQNRVLKSMVDKRTDELRNTQLQVVQRLGMAVESRDKQTGNHILRMSHIARLLAQGIKWNDTDCDLILNASPMHDIGKIGIADSILLKPGKLDSAEWEVMKSHTTIGAQLLSEGDSDLMSMAHDIALTHHEKWDGSGYPHGLAGTDIPQAGRIAALADVVDALVSKRPYKEGWTIEETIAHVEENSGRHFDPDLVEVFLTKLPQVQEIQQRFSE